MGINEMGVDEVGVDEMGSRRSGATPDEVPEAVKIYKIKNKIKTTIKQNTCLECAYKLS